MTAFSITCSKMSTPALNTAAPLQVKQRLTHRISINNDVDENLAGSWKKMEKSQALVQCDIRSAKES